MQRIFLIGYMGAGKTTVGKALSKELGLTFYDLDWYIEGRRHRTIPQLFEQEGEEGFRKIERNMLHEVAEFENILLSCGGGTPCFFDNIDYMNQQGSVIDLKTSPEVLCKHLRMGHTERPLLKGKNDEQLLQFVTEQLKQREPYYNKARVTIDVSLMDTFEKIRITVEKIKEILPKPPLPI